MAWIKFDVSTSDKPEVWQMAQALEIDPDAVVGKLLRVWAWFDEQTETGNAPSVTKALLDRRIGVTGFCAAMIAAGWMTETESQISLPNFDRHNGDTAKKRALTAKRVADYKSGNAKVTQQITQPLKNSNAGVTRDALPREDKKREDKKNNTPPNPQRGNREKVAYQFCLDDIPPHLSSSQAFNRAWVLWLKHRAEIRKPVTASSAKTQLTQLGKLGPETAVEWIEYTIAKGWQGLAAPDPTWQRSVRKHEQFGLSEELGF